MLINKAYLVSLQCPVSCAVVSISLEVQTYTVIEEVSSPPLSVCVGLSGTIERNVVIEAHTMDGTAVGKH